MSETTETTTEAPKKKGPKTTPSKKAKLSRKTLKAAYRKKKAAKILADKEFAKTFFENRSKRSNDKKSAFRKRHAKK